MQHNATVDSILSFPSISFPHPSQSKNEIEKLGLEGCLKKIFFVFAWLDVPTSTLAQQNKTTTTTNMDYSPEGAEAGRSIFTGLEVAEAVGHTPVQGLGKEFEVVGTYVLDKGETEVSVEEEGVEGREETRSS